MIEELFTSWDCLNGNERQTVLNIAKQHPFTIEDTATIFIFCDRDENQTQLFASLISLGASFDQLLQLKRK